MATGGGYRFVSLLRYGLLAAAAAFDLLTVDRVWPALLFLAIAVVAALAVGRPGLALLTALLSLVVTGLVAVVRPAGTGSFGMAEIVALLLLLAALVRRSAAPFSGLRAVAVVVALLALPLRIVSGDTPVIELAVSAAAAVAVAFGASLRTADAVGRQAALAVQQAEREAIARELHDVVAHHVTGIVVAAQAARFTSAAAPPMAEIEAAGERALEAMRGLVAVLRTDPAEQAPLAPVATLAALPELVDRFQRAESATRVEAELPAGDTQHVPWDVQASVYRIVQESLTNIHRHASGASSAQVTIRQEDRGMLIEVRSSAPRERPRTSGGDAGYGLIGMQERAAALGGSFAAGLDGTDWLVRAVLPVVDR